MIYHSPPKQPEQFMETSVMNTYVVGDVHGRLSQLKALIGSLDYDPKRDRIVLLGDLIDRGEDSPGVVNSALELQEESAIFICLRGTHEHMLLDLIGSGDLLGLVGKNGGAVPIAQSGYK